MAGASRPCRRGVRSTVHAPGALPVPLGSFCFSGLEREPHEPVPGGTPLIPEGVPPRDAGGPDECLPGALGRSARFLHPSEVEVCPGVGQEVSLPAGEGDGAVRPRFSADLLAVLERQRRDPEGKWRPVRQDECCRLGVGDCRPHVLLLARPAGDDRTRLSHIRGPAPRR